MKAMKKAISSLNLELIQNSSNTFLNDYINLLKTNMMTTPNERTMPTILKNKITNLFKSIDRNKIQNLKKILVDQYSIKDGMQKIEKNMAMSIIDDKKNDQIVYKN
jgi:hypothetical protein